MRLMFPSPKRQTLRPHFVYHRGTSRPGLKASIKACLLLITFNVQKKSINMSIKMRSCGDYETAAAEQEQLPFV